jgi:hypothetical protein
MLGWIIIVILAVVAAGWSWIVFMGNAMSDSPGMAFQGTWTIAVAWVIVGAAVWWKVWG